MLLLTLTPFHGFAQMDPLSQLSALAATNSQIKLTLGAYPDVTYVIESSSDLQNWTPWLTNTQPESVREIYLNTDAEVCWFRARRGPISVFGAAIETGPDIDLNGHSLQTDSYDSTDPMFSTNGLYPSGLVSMTRDHGDVLTRGSLKDSGTNGSARIKGMLRVGPNGSIQVGDLGSIGDRAWVEGTNSGIEPGHSTNDFVSEFPVPTLPPNWTAVVPVRGLYFIDGVMYDYSLTNGQWRLSNLSAGNFKIYVWGNAQMLVTSALSMTGSDVIRLGTNASLQLFMTGGRAVVGGNGFANPNGNVASFTFFGLTGNTNVTLAGNSSFVGTIYAPNSDLLIGGGGLNTYNFTGAVLAKSLKLNGHYYFHFDENLKRTAPFH